MNINWSEVTKSVLVNIITGILVGAVGAYILFSISFRQHEDRLKKLEDRPFVTFTGHATGGSDAKAVIVVPEGQKASLLIVANGFAASASNQFRASIAVSIEVNTNIVASELIWIPQYLYDPLKFGGGAKDPKLTEEQLTLQRNSPLVATPIQRLERMGPIELRASTSAIVELDAGTHTIRAICVGDDNTSRRVELNYIDVRNSSGTQK
jgi:hypothetical protein